MKELVLDQGFRMYHLMIQRKNFLGTLPMMKRVMSRLRVDKRVKETRLMKVMTSDKDDDDNDDEEELTKKDDEETDSGKRGDEVSERSEDESNDEEDQELRLSEEARIQKEEEADELYRDVNINQGIGLQVTQNVEHSHVTLTPVNPDGLQESSSMSSIVTSMLNPTSDVGVESIFTTASCPIVSLQTPTPIMTPSTIATITTSSEAPIPPTTIPSIILENLPTFNSVFCFDERLRSLETTFSEYRQTNPFVDAVSAILGIVHQYMTQQMTEAVREAVQIQTDRLQDSLQRENDEFLRNIDENMKKIIKGQVKNQVKEQVSCILPRIEESVNATLEAEVQTRSSHSSRTSYAIAADLLEMELKKILIEKMEGNNEDERMMIRKDPPLDQTGGLKEKRRSESAFAEEPVQTTCQMEEPPHPVFETGADDQPIDQTSQHPECDLARQTDARSSFNELLDTPIDFSNFIMNRLNVDTLTPEVLAGPTYELMRRSCNSLTELEYHLEEVYKETTDQLDWVNPDGQQYPHNLMQPLPLIPDNREPINYDKNALWGVSHWGRKRHQFYRFAVNRESALDVYSKRRIISVMDLKIMEWHSYKHLDWITIRRDDDKLYKFKEGDFKRLRLQDIEDMLLLFVQGKLSNLTVEERFAFNVSLMMFTRSIVIQRRVEDLQLGVESYQKRLNLTKTDTYRSDLKRREAYTAYSNPRGFIYQNKDKKNRWMRIDKLYKFSDGMLNDVRNALDDRLKLKRREAYTAYSNPRGFIYQNKDKKNRWMRIDKLYKFSDGMLNDVRNALDDRLKGTRMQYLPQTIWRKGDKDRASAMIQAIDKMLKTRRIMRSLKSGIVTHGFTLIVLSALRRYDNENMLSLVILILSGIVTHWFTLIVLSALRRSDDENMLSLVILILRSILTDLQVTPTKPG
uniref:Uncharacterized protein n=1 Tax=Tanacetum cinerariifolium TaxID=118510 RepID=A0A6L2JLR3_TANCI|nr:hypothetical protein [Tanacetum cinerariifolium]